MGLERGEGRGDAFLQFGRLDLVGLGQDDLVAHRRLVQRLEDVDVDVLEAVPRVDQHIDARQAAAALQELVDQVGPGRDLGLRGLRIAVAGHVDEPQVAALRAVEEDQFLGAAGCVRGPRQAVAAGQRVDEAGLADIGASGEGDLEALHRRQRFDRRRCPDEAPVAGEQLSAAFHQVIVGVGGHATTNLSVVMAGTSQA